MLLRQLVVCLQEEFISLTKEVKEEQNLRHFQFSSCFCESQLCCIHLLKLLKELLTSFKQFHMHYIFTTSQLWHEVSAGVGYWNYVNGTQSNNPLTKVAEPNKKLHENQRAALHTTFCNNRLNDKPPLVHVKTNYPNKSKIGRQCPKLFKDASSDEKETLSVLLSVA